uniref:4Fe-4S ferredoxin-type domain-containing protein n=1 Tax=Cuerna arida TaxID=1464854 RepID=A0A1B6GPD0_9HEMI
MFLHFLLYFMFFLSTQNGPVKTIKRILPEPVLVDYVDGKFVPVPCKWCDVTCPTETSKDPMTQGTILDNAVREVHQFLMLLCHMMNESKWFKLFAHPTLCYD